MWANSRITPRLRLTALLTAMIFMVTSVVDFQAASAMKTIPSKQLSIPKSLGRVDASFKGDSGKTVVLIQDLHTSVNAQKNIAEMIKYLVKKEGVQTVYEEGYEGVVPTNQLFGQLKNSQVKKRVAEFYLDQLRIGGAEYAHILAGDKFNLIGADDQALHQKNVQAYRAAVQYQSEISQEIKDIESELDALTNTYYEANFKRWLQDRKKYRNHQLPLIDYLDRTWNLLGRQSEESEGGDMLRKEFPAVSLLLTASTSNDSEILNRVERINLSYLETELSSLEAKLLKQFLHDDLLKNLWKYQNLFETLRLLNQLQLTPSDYARLKSDLEDFNAQALAQFLSTIKDEPVFLSRRWQSFIQNALSFYEAAMGRHEAIAKRMDSFLKEKGEKTTAIVFGGFHSPSIKEILSKRNISYVVVTPANADISPRHESKYHNLMSVGHHAYDQHLLSKSSRTESVFNLAIKGSAEQIENQILYVSLLVEPHVHLEDEILFPMVEQELALSASETRKPAEVINDPFDVYLVREGLQSVRAIFDQNTPEIQWVKEMLLADSALRPVFLIKLESFANEVPLKVHDYDLLNEIGGEELIREHTAFSLGGLPNVERAIAKKRTARIIVGVTDKESKETIHQGNYMPVANGRQAFFPLADGTLLSIKGAGQNFRSSDSPFYPLMERLGHTSKYWGLVADSDLELAEKHAFKASEHNHDFAQFIASQQIKYAVQPSGRIVRLADNGLVDFYNPDGFFPSLVFNRYLTVHRISKFPQVLKADPKLARFREKLALQLGIDPQDFSGKEYIRYLAKKFGRQEALKQNRHLVKSTFHAQDFTLAGEEGDLEELMEYNSFIQWALKHHGERAEKVIPWIRQYGLNIYDLIVKVQTIYRIYEGIDPEDRNYFEIELKSLVKSFMEGYFEALSDREKEKWGRFMSNELSLDESMSSVPSERFLESAKEWFQEHINFTIAASETRLNLKTMRKPWLLSNESQSKQLASMAKVNHRWMGLLSVSMYGLILLQWLLSVQKYSLLSLQVILGGYFFILGQMIADAIYRSRTLPAIEQETLQTRGPYQYLQHPMHATYFLSALIFTVLNPGYFSIPALVIQTVLTLWAPLIDRNVLWERFQSNDLRREVYKSYTKETPLFIPKLSKLLRHTQKFRSETRAVTVDWGETEPFSPEDGSMRHQLQFASDEDVINFIPEQLRKAVDKVVVTGPTPEAFRSGWIQVLYLDTENKEEVMRIDLRMDFDNQDSVMIAGPLYGPYIRNLIPDQNERHEIMLKWYQEDFPQWLNDREFTEAYFPTYVPYLEEMGFKHVETKDGDRMVLYVPKQKVKQKSGLDEDSLPFKRLNLPADVPEDQIRGQIVHWIKKQYGFKRAGLGVDYEGFISEQYPGLAIKVSFTQSLNPLDLYPQKTKASRMNMSKAFDPEVVFHEVRIPVFLGKKPVENLYIIFQRRADYMLQDYLDTLPEDQKAAVREQAFKFETEVLWKKYRVFNFDPSQRDMGVIVQGDGSIRLVVVDTGSLHIVPKEVNTRRRMMKYLRDFMGRKHFRHDREVEVPIEPDEEQVETPTPTPKPTPPLKILGSEKLGNIYQRLRTMAGYEDPQKEQPVVQSQEAPEPETPQTETKTVSKRNYLYLSNGEFFLRNLYYVKSARQIEDQGTAELRKATYLHEGLHRRYPKRYAQIYRKVRHPIVIAAHNAAKEQSEATLVETGKEKLTEAEAWKSKEAYLGVWDAPLARPIVEEALEFVADVFFDVLEDKVPEPQEPQVSKSETRNQLEELMELYYDTHHVKLSPITTNVYGVTTPSGRYILKEPRFRQDAEYIRWETSLLDEAKRKGNRVAVRVKTITGDDYFEYQGSKYVLYERIGGSKLNSGAGLPRQIIQVGAATAKLNDDLQDYTPEGMNYSNGEQPFGIPLINVLPGLKKIEDLYQDLVALPIGDLTEIERIFTFRYPQEVAPVIKRLRDTLDPIRIDNLRKGGQLIFTNVQGDNHRGNVHFFDMDYLGHFDFEFAHFDARLTDIAMDWMAKTANTRFERVWDEQNILAYLTGYDSGTSTPITDSEFELLPPALELLQLEAMYFLINMAAEGVPFTEKHLDETIKLMQGVHDVDWQRHFDTVIVARAAERKQKKSHRELLIEILLPMVALTFGLWGGIESYLLNGDGAYGVTKHLMQLLLYIVPGSIMAFSANYLMQIKNSKEYASINKSLRFVMAGIPLALFWFFAKPEIKLMLDAYGPAAMVAVDSLIGMVTHFLFFYSRSFWERGPKGSFHNEVRSKFWPTFGELSILWGAVNFGLYQVSVQYAYLIPILSSIIAFITAYIFSYRLHTEKSSRYVRVMQWVGLLVPAMSMFVLGYIYEDPGLKLIAAINAALLGGFGVFTLWTWFTIFRPARVIWENGNHLYPDVDVDGSLALRSESDIHVFVPLAFRPYVDHIVVEEAPSLRNPQTGVTISARNRKGEIVFESSFVPSLQHVQSVNLHGGGYLAFVRSRFKNTEVRQQVMLDWFHQTLGPFLISRGFNYIDFYGTKSFFNEMGFEIYEDKHNGRIFSRLDLTKPMIARAETRKGLFEQARELVRNNSIHYPIANEHVRISDQIGLVKKAGLSGDYPILIINIDPHHDAYGRRTILEDHLNDANWKNVLEVKGDAIVYNIMPAGGKLSQGGLRNQDGRLVSPLLSERGDFDSHDPFSMYKFKELVDAEVEVDGKVYKLTEYPGKIWLSVDYDFFSLVKTIPKYYPAYQTLKVDFYHLEQPEIREQLDYFLELFSEIGLEISEVTGYRSKGYLHTDASKNSWMSKMDMEFMRFRAAILQSQTSEQPTASKASSETRSIGPELQHQIDNYLIQTEGEDITEDLIRQYDPALIDIRERLLQNEDPVFVAALDELGSSAYFTNDRTPRYWQQDNQAGARPVIPDYVRWRGYWHGGDRINPARSVSLDLVETSAVTSRGTSLVDINGVGEGYAEFPIRIHNGVFSSLLSALYWHGNHANDAIEEMWIALRLQELALEVFGAPLDIAMPYKIIRPYQVPYQGALPDIDDYFHEYANQADPDEARRIQEILTEDNFHELMTGKSRRFFSSQRMTVHDWIEHALEQTPLVQTQSRITSDLRGSADFVGYVRDYEYGLRRENADDLYRRLFSAYGETYHGSVALPIVTELDNAWYEHRLHPDGDQNRLSSRLGRQLGASPLSPHAQIRAKANAIEMLYSFTGPFGPVIPIPRDENLRYLPEVQVYENNQEAVERIVARAAQNLGHAIGLALGIGASIDEAIQGRNLDSFSRPKDFSFAEHFPRRNQTSFDPVTFEPITHKMLVNADLALSSLTNFLAGDHNKLKNQAAEMLKVRILDTFNLVQRVIIDNPNSQYVSREYKQDFKEWRDQKGQAFIENAVSHLGREIISVSKSETREKSFEKGIVTIDEEATIKEALQLAQRTLSGDNPTPEIFEALADYFDRSNYLIFRDEWMPDEYDPVIDGLREAILRGLSNVEELKRDLVLDTILFSLWENLGPHDEIHGGWLGMRHDGNRVQFVYRDLGRGFNVASFQFEEGHGLHALIDTIVRVSGGQVHFESHGNSAIYNVDGKVTGPSQIIDGLRIVIDFEIPTNEVVAESETRAVVDEVATFAEAPDPRVKVEVNVLDALHSAIAYLNDSSVRRDDASFDQVSLEILPAINGTGTVVLDPSSNLWGGEKRIRQSEPKVHWQFALNELVTEVAANMRRDFNGKLYQKQVTFDAYLEKNSIVLVASDDGGGIAPQILSEFVDWSPEKRITDRKTQTGGDGMRFIYEAAQALEATVKVETRRMMGEGESHRLIKFWFPLKPNAQMRAEDAAENAVAGTTITVKIPLKQSETRAPAKVYSVEAGTKLESDDRHYIGNVDAEGIPLGRGALYLVGDGSGTDDGNALIYDFISQNFPEMFRHRLEMVYQRNDIPDIVTALRESFNFLQEAWVQMETSELASGQREKPSKTLSTLAVIYVPYEGEDLFVANAGDTTALVFDDEKLIYESPADNFRANPNAWEDLKERADAKGAKVTNDGTYVYSEVTPSGMQLTRGFFGTGIADSAVFVPEPHIQAIPFDRVQGNLYLLILTDGVLDPATSIYEERKNMIIQLVRQGASPEEIVSIASDFDDRTALLRVIEAPFVQKRLAKSELRISDDIKQMEQQIEQTHEAAVLVDFVDMVENFSDAEVKDILYLASSETRRPPSILYNYDPYHPKAGKLGRLLKKKKFKKLRLENGNLRNALVKHNKSLGRRVIHYSSHRSETRLHDFDEFNLEGDRFYLLTNRAGRGSLLLGLSDITHDTVRDQLPDYYLLDPFGRLYLSEFVSTRLRDWSRLVDRSVVFARAA